MRGWTRGGPPAKEVRRQKFFSGGGREGGLAPLLGGAMPPYEEVGLGEMDWDADLGAYTWECPCGDLFQITPVRIAPPPPPPPPPAAPLGCARA